MYGWLMDQQSNSRPNDWKLSSRDKKVDYVKRKWMITICCRPEKCVILSSEFGELRFFMLQFTTFLAHAKTWAELASRQLGLIKFADDVTFQVLTDATARRQEVVWTRVLMASIILPKTSTVHSGLKRKPKVKKKLQFLINNPKSCGLFEWRFNPLCSGGNSERRVWEHHD